MNTLFVTWTEPSTKKDYFAHGLVPTRPRPKCTTEIVGPSPKRQVPPDAGRRLNTGLEPAPTDAKRQASATILSHVHIDARSNSLHPYHPTHWESYPLDDAVYQCRMVFQLINTGKIALM
ncbi:MAG: hypothetical protein IPP66_19405 [Anaerolineales bacterium]|nr:hypothetical protein [Anaerolineales bacterium]